MAAKLTTTIRLGREDADALVRARKSGQSASELFRKGLRIVAARFYRHRRAPAARLFVSTDAKLGDESELFGNLEK